MAVVISGLVSYFAVQRLRMPGGWDALFTLVSIGAVVLLVVLAEVARHRTGDYLGRFVHRLATLTGRQLESSRIIRFILDVEDIVLGWVWAAAARWRSHAAWRQCSGRRSGWFSTLASTPNDQLPRTNHFQLPRPNDWALGVVGRW